MRDKPASADDPLNFIYLPSGRCVGFVRGSEGVARAVIKDIFDNDARVGRKPVHWQDKGYVLRRPGQKPPGKVKPKRKRK